MSVPQSTKKEIGERVEGKMKEAAVVEEVEGKRRRGYLHC